jgi:hypothetical protein
MSQTQKFGDTYNAKNKTLNKRYDITLEFLAKHINTDKKILDLGIENPLSTHMKERGYSVVNTEAGVDLDLDTSVVDKVDYDVVTAFEIFEHMVAPFNILREIKGDYLVTSIPLKLWFADAYWSDKDPWDRHYHEFEPKQFDMLLEKSGWKIMDSYKWTSSSNKIGLRPLLRRVTPRYYIVYCERAK